MSSHSSRSTEHSSKISSQSAPAKGERAHLERATQADTTPQRLSAFTRAHAPDAYAKDIAERIRRELEGCRWISQDLVDHAFGPIISINLASAILEQFLRTGAVTVSDSSGRDVSYGKAVRLARQAANVYQATEQDSTSGTSGTRKKDSLVWSWDLWEHPPIREGSKHEPQVAAFLNALAELAYQAIATLKRTDELGSHEPRNLFSPMLINTVAHPLADAREKGRNQPDTLLLPFKAFPQTPSATSASTVTVEFLVARSSATVHDHVDDGDRASGPPRKRARTAKWTGRVGETDTLADAPVIDDNLPSLPPPNGHISLQGPPTIPRLSFYANRIRPRAPPSMPFAPLAVRADISAAAMSILTMGSNIVFPSTSDVFYSPPARANLPRSLSAPMPDTQSTALTAASTLRNFGRDRTPLAEYAHWQQTRGVGEGKETDMDLAIPQCHRYLRALRRAQPWLRFCLGFCFTGKRKNNLDFTLLRADSTGVEECVFDLNKSRGALDFIRAALGFVLSTDEELGADPLMDVAERVDDVQSGQKRAPPPSTGYIGRVLERVCVDPARAFHCSVSNTLFDTMSLRGRGTRVWAVKWDGKGEDWAAFSSPSTGEDSECLALKASWQPLERASIEASIINTAKDHRAEHISSHRVLLAIKQWVHIAHDAPFTTLGSIRGFAEEDWPSIGAESRVLQFSLMARKRPVSAFRSLQEFVGAVVDAIKGHEYLCSIGILHRDISEGNIGLALDAEREGTRGYLMDLDMASVVSQSRDTVKKDRDDRRNWGKPQENIAKKHGPPRTGTTPYMAVGVLRGGTHEPRHDLESFFYVVFLFLFTYNGPLPLGKPAGCLDHACKWPDNIQNWDKGTYAQIEGSKLRVLQEAYCVRDELTLTTAKYFQPGSNGVRSMAINVLVTDFYDQLWEKGHLKLNIHHADVCRALENWLTEFPDEEWTEQEPDPMEEPDAVD